MLNHGYLTFWSNFDYKLKHVSNLFVVLVYIIFVTLGCTLLIHLRLQCSLKAVCIVVVSWLYNIITHYAMCTDLKYIINH